VTGIYDAPEVYKLACAFRDVTHEVDVLLRWYRRHRAEPIRSVLELAAGPAEHATEFARRGIAATALDLNPAMCAHARERAAAAGLSLTVVEADMRTFRLPGRFDLVITMLDSTCHLLTLDDLIAHLGSVAAHLDSGGIYIMEMSHPADRLTDRPRSGNQWHLDRDGVGVDVRWGGPDDKIDPITQVTEDHVVITIHDDAGTRVITDVVPNRFWTSTEVLAAVRLAGGFTVVARCGDFDDDTPLDSADAWRMITVLRRE
jgi:SAM-dependent methyltransferase